MNIQQMKYVICTAEYGSFSHAARKLFVTQPSLSNAIKELEQELGIKIFERKNNGVSLTEDGKTLLEYVTSIMEQIQTVGDYYKRRKESEIRFSVACQHSSIACEAMYSLMKDFGDQSYQIQLLEVRTREVLDYLERGLCDIGILLKNSSNKVLEWEMEQKKLEFHLLSRQRPHVFLHKEHPLSEKEELTKEDLEPYPYSKYFQGTDSMRFFSEELIESYNPKQIITITDKYTDGYFASRLNAYTLGSGFNASKDSEDDFVSIPLRSNEIIDLGWVIVKDKKLSPMIQDYIKALEMIMKEQMQ